jgi:hypothetical protein
MWKVREMTEDDHAAFDAAPSAGRPSWGWIW